MATIDPCAAPPAAPALRTGRVPARATPRGVPLFFARAKSVPTAGKPAPASTWTINPLGRIPRTPGITVLAWTPSAPVLARSSQSLPSRTPILPATTAATIASRASALVRTGAPTRASGRPQTTNFSLGTAISAPAPILPKWSAQNVNAGPHTPFPGTLIPLSRAPGTPPARAQSAGPPRTLGPIVPSWTSWTPPRRGTAVWWPASPAFVIGRPMTTNVTLARLPLTPPPIPVWAQVTNAPARYPFGARPLFPVRVNGHSTKRAQVAYPPLARPVWINAPNLAPRGRTLILRTPRPVDLATDKVTASPRHASTVRAGLIVAEVVVTSTPGSTDYARALWYDWW